MFPISGKTDPRVEALRHLDLFSQCSGAELRDVAAITTEVRMAAGETLCRQGAVGREAFVIVDGDATVAIDGLPVGTVGPGDIVGEIALLDHAPRTATVVATVPVTALVLSTIEFRQLLRSAPTATRRMLALMGARLRAADEAVVSSR